MSKLRSAVETWEEMFSGRSPLAPEFKCQLKKFVEARDDAMRQVCADAALEYTGHAVYATVFDDQLKAAILAAAKPPEDLRERLGRAVQQGFHAMKSTTWDNLPPESRETYCRAGDAVLAALEENADG